MGFKTLHDLNVQDKTILLRVDLNVPYHDGRVTDATRIDRLKPTIDYLVEHGAKIILLSHFGRPKGERKMEYSLSFLPPVLKERWGYDIAFASECTGDEAQKLAGTLASGQIGLLENLRFHKGEEENDPGFARKLAALGDFYVNDAFSSAHRAHASTEALAHLLPCAAGMLMESELKALSDALENPQKPVIAIVGGAKVSTKLSVLNNLVKKVDKLVLGGGMANTFLFAKGLDIGLSLCEKDMAEKALAIIQTANENNCEIILPIDLICAKEFKANATHEIHPSDGIPADMMALDIGPETIRLIKQKLQECKTVLWNGPLGAFEIAPFDTATNEAAREVAALTKDGKMVSVAGGGDTVAALDNAGIATDFSYISTAGGAFLEWLEGRTLPGVAALHSTIQDAA